MHTYEGEGWLFSTPMLLFWRVGWAILGSGIALAIGSTFETNPARWALLLYTSVNLLGTVAMVRTMLDHKREPPLPLDSRLWSERASLLGRVSFVLQLPFGALFIILEGL